MIVMNLLPLVCAVLSCCGTSTRGWSEDDFRYGTFPDDFMWGTATSAYQIEGGWDADGKGPSIWDTFCHGGGEVANNHTGDVACDSYNQFEEDIKLMKAMNVDFYRFSISWPRVMSDGTVNSTNDPGIDYYNRLINALVAQNITPMATLYHWDLPQALQDIGGWENETLVTYFRDYADLCFDRFGDRVKHWITLNEPWVIAWLGYGLHVKAPGVNRPDTAAYNAGHTMIKAHAEAWHLYNDNYRQDQKGQISITLDSAWCEPEDASEENRTAAERCMQFKLGWFAHPIFVNGNYPQVMIEKVQEKSSAEGLNESRLPMFTEEEKMRIKGTHDFFGLNHYTTELAYHCVKNNETSYDNDKDACTYQDDSWPSSGSFWLKAVPWGFRKLLKFIKDNYGDPRVIVTENGMSDRNATMQDDHRIYYYKYYINEMLKAIDEDGVDVFGYTAWSLMDNFEWEQGYVEKFGLHHVDFDDPDRPRTAKASAAFYSEIIENNGFLPDATNTPIPTPSGCASNKITVFFISTLLWAVWMAA